MARLPLVALVCLVANLATSQTPPPPHTARQALIEMFFGTGPNHLEKHLPDITRNAFKKMPSANGMNSLDEFSMIASQLKAGGKFETFETGPTLDQKLASNAPADLIASGVYDRDLACRKCRKHAIKRKDTASIAKCLKMAPRPV